MLNYGKGFEALEMIQKQPIKKTITDCFGYLGEDHLRVMMNQRVKFNRWSDFFYSLDEFYKSVFVSYIDELIK